MVALLLCFNSCFSPIRTPSPLTIRPAYAPALPCPFTCPLTAIRNRHLVVPVAVVAVVFCLDFGIASRRFNIFITFDSHMFCIPRTTDKHIMQQHTHTHTHTLTVPFPATVGHISISDSISDCSHSQRCPLAATLDEVGRRRREPLMAATL